MCTFAIVHDPGDTARVVWRPWTTRGFRGRAIPGAVRGEDLLGQRVAQAIDEAALDLALAVQRVERPPDVLRGVVAVNADQAGVWIDRNLRHVHREARRVNRLGLLVPMLANLALA